MFGVRKEMDERAVAIEHKAGHAAFVVIGYLLVLDMALHGLRPGVTDRNGFPVDILVITAAGAFTHLTVTLRERTLGPRRGLVMVAAMVVAVAVAAVVSKAILK